MLARSFNRAARAETAPHNHQQVWIRANGEMPDDPLLHVCAVTYASDMTLLDSTVNDSHGPAARRFGTAPASTCHTSCITCLLCDGSDAPATAATQPGGPVG